jgi:hypothetical protein
MLAFASTFPKNVTWMKGLLLASLYLLLTGCHSRPDDGAPLITFSKVPPASLGGVDKLNTISGRVSGARTNRQIVLFAKAGEWWVQPFTNQPYTAIQPDGTWTNTTHLGSDYAALLVEPGYRPPAKTGTLPPAGGDGVVVVASTHGAPSSPEAMAPIEKTIRFSGYDWKVRTRQSDRGGQIHLYRAANVWTDPSGFLHLKISRESDEWTCAEVNLTRSFGYGTYLFVVHDISHLEPAAALSMFTWSDLGVEQNHREMDIELSRWGSPSSKNAQYVVQPYYVPANVARFTAPAGTVAYSFRWEPDSISFESTRGASRTARQATISTHVYTSEIPSPGDESAHLHLCSYSYGQIPLQHEAEVVIEKFQYLP